MYGGCGHVLDVDPWGLTALARLARLQALARLPLLPTQQALVRRAMFSLLLNCRAMSGQVEAAAWELLGRTLPAV